MIKTITLLSMLLTIHLASMSQSTVVVGWSFPGNSALADTGLAVNLNNEIETQGGTSGIELKNGFTTKAAQATGWQDGMDTKAWVIALSTTGYENLTISSRQQSGGNDPGPKDFKIQYSIDMGATWTDVDNGSIAVENDWETSYVDHLPLPEACNNQGEVMIRWLMVSNEASGGAGAVLETGKSKIDEIFVKGEMINAVGEYRSHQITIGPNPSTGYFSINSSVDINSVLIHDRMGRLIQETSISNSKQSIDVSDLEEGVYLLSFLDNKGEIVGKEKMVIR